MTYSMHFFDEEGHFEEDLSEDPLIPGPMGLGSCLGKQNIRSLLYQTRLQVQVADSVL